MAVDDLTRPLGIDADPPASRAPRLRAGSASLLLALPAGVVATLAIWLAIARDPLGGEPVAVATIERPARIEAAVAPAARADAEPTRAPGPNRQVGKEIEDNSGVRVLRPSGTSTPGVLIVRVPDAPASVRLAAAPDRRLVEKSRHGPLPQVSADGARPSDVYARPLGEAQQSAKVRVAIVVGGLGIGATATNDAVSKLPGVVSLAFAPYGGDLERQVARARESGHEVLLHAPMEPFDYPDNDPGPQTMLTSLPAAQNIDRLHWLLSRFPGFVGVTNFMGARFTSNDAALAPVLKEIGDRGLIYLDDGSSARSVASSIAAGFGLAAARGDVVLDAVQRPADIDAALQRLEAIAKEKGQAIGVATALPVSVDRIQRWIKAAEARGVTLVPVSALAPRQRRT